MQGDTNQTELQRTMKGRHLFMIALGGVIGTGLFLGSGFTISEAGPIGAILAYVIGGFLMYLVMLCLGVQRTNPPEIEVGLDVELRKSQLRGDEHASE